MKRCLTTCRSASQQVERYFISHCGSRMPKVGGLLDVIRRDGLGAGLAQYVDMSSLAGVYSPTRPSLSDKAAPSPPTPLKPASCPHSHPFSQPVDADPATSQRLPSAASQRCQSRPRRASTVSRRCVSRLHEIALPGDRGLNGVLARHSDRRPP